MHPPELLDRREARRQGVRIDRAVLGEKTEPVFQREELVAVRLLVLDGEADEIVGRLPLFPVHRQEGHPLAAMDFQREQRVIVRSRHFEFAGHGLSPEEGVPAAVKTLPPAGAAVFYCFCSSCCRRFCRSSIVCCCSFTTLVSTATMSIDDRPLRSAVATRSGTSSAMKPTCFSPGFALYANVTGSRPRSASNAASRSSVRMSCFTARLEALIQFPASRRAPLLCWMAYAGTATPRPMLPVESTTSELLGADVLM